MDLDKIAIFVQVVRAGSFAEASRRLGKPSNSISRHIQQLEIQLGTRLLQRSTRKLTLSAAGRELYDRCAPAIENIAEAADAVLEKSKIPSGVVRFSAPVDFFEFFKIEWIWEFLSANPAIRLQCILNDSRMNLLEENIDVAIRGGYISDPTLVTRKLASFHLCLVASADYIEKHGQPKNLESLSNHQCILRETPTNSATWAFEGLDGLREVRVSGYFSANSPQVMLRACHAGLGIALLPSLLIAKDVKTKKLVKVLPEFRTTSMVASLVYLNRRHLPKAVSAIIEFFIKKHDEVIMDAD